MELRNHHWKFKDLHSKDISMERAVAAWIAFADQTDPKSEVTLALENLRSDSVHGVKVENVPWPVHTERRIV